MGLTYATFMTSVYHPIVYGFDLCYLYDQCLSPHSLWVWLMLPLWPVSITPLSMGLTYATFMTSVYHPIVYGFDLCYLYDQCLSPHSLWVYDLCYLYDQSMSMHLYDHCLWVWLMLPLWPVSITPLSMGLTYATFMTSVYHPIVYGFDLCYLYDQCLSPHSLWVWLMLPLWPVSITPLSMVWLMLPLWPVSITPLSMVWLMLPLWPLSMGLTYATFMTSVYHPIVYGFDLCYLYDQCLSPHSLWVWLMLPLWPVSMGLTTCFDLCYLYDQCLSPHCLWVWLMLPLWPVSITPLWVWLCYLYDHVYGFDVCYLYDQCLSPHSLWVWLMLPLWPLSMGLTYATFMTSVYHPIVYGFDLWPYGFDLPLWPVSITPLSMGLTYATFMTSVYHPIVYGFDLCYLYDQCLSPHSLWVWLMLPLWPVSITPLSMGLTYATFMTSVYHPIVYGFDLCYLYDQCLSPHCLWVWLMLPLWPVSITPLSMGLTYATFMTSVYHPIVYGFDLCYLYDHCLWVWLMLPLWPLSMGLTYVYGFDLCYLYDQCLSPHCLWVWLMLPLWPVSITPLSMGLTYATFMTSVYHPIVYGFDLCYLYDQCLSPHCLWVWLMLPLWPVSITPLSMGLTYATFMTSVYHPIVYGFDLCYLYDQCLSPHCLWVWLMLPLWPVSITASMGLTYATIMTSVYHPIVYGFDLCYLYDQCLSPHCLWVWLMLPLWPVSITPLSMGLTYATFMTSVYHPIVYGFDLCYLYDHCLWVWRMLPLWPVSITP